MKLRSPFVWFSWVILLCSAPFMSLGQAGGAPTVSAPQSRGVIKIARVSGEVFAIDKATGLRTRLAENSLVSDNQLVETGHNASVVLVFSNGAVVNVKADSQLEISEFLQNPFSDTFRIRDASHEPSISTTKLYLRKGEIISQVKKLNRDAGSSFTVETAVGAAGIRGTAFRLSYVMQRTIARFGLSMAEGLIRFSPLSGRPVDVPAGKEIGVSARINAATSAVTSVTPPSAPKDVSPSVMAELQQQVTDSVGAALNVQFSASLPTGATTTGATNPAVSNPAPTTAEASSTDTDTSPLASPPPVPAAQRTTPGDGL